MARRGVSQNDVKAKNLMKRTKAEEVSLGCYETFTGGIDAFLHFID